ncbi:hypothetical protein SAMN04488063_2887 [Halopelagius inordinatus]|uniref:Uncharacterized protein n=1 Tax=Halopelagius inordinatus TaxID=553467 RepID=A0A1I2UJE1_9EURY|nr:hypothetical protein [Halopelagius inordinatus]SFG77163.1 hypothetical protein SAMN04488063_2887 [Halopelagius inordinatus]
MSSVSSQHNETPLRRSIGVASTAAKMGLRSMEAVTFWAAVLLPFAYLPLLLGGLGEGEQLVFTAFVAANVFALVVGHDHGRE